MTIFQLLTIVILGVSMACQSSLPNRADMSNSYSRRQHYEMAQENEKTNWQSTFDRTTLSVNNSNVYWTALHEDQSTMENSYLRVQKSSITTAQYNFSLGLPDSYGNIIHYVGQILTGRDYSGRLLGTIQRPTLCSSNQFLIQGISTDKNTGTFLDTLFIDHCGIHGNKRNRHIEFQLVTFVESDSF